MTQHLIKLVVGVQDLDDYAKRQQEDLMSYKGQQAAPCWTRFQPKRAEEILENDGRIYRVINNRIQCWHHILGFEMVEVEGKGKMCMIMQDPTIMQTVSTPHRPFQGWRYFDPTKAPKDRGVYELGTEACDIPPAMAKDLKESGLL